METKTVAITMGDPAGIGPEIIVKALSEDGLNGAPLVVIGCLATLKRLQAKGAGGGFSVSLREARHRVSVTGRRTG